MQILKKSSLLLCWLGIWACQAPEQPGLLQENSATRLVEVAPVLSPEEHALLNKIANRTLLQEVIDNTPQEQIQRTNFACSAQSGGLVAYVHKEQELRGIRLSLSQEKAGRSTRWYYQNKKTAALIAHEQSQWQGNQEHIQQTVFYLDGDKVLQVLHRVVQAAPNRLEAALEKTSFGQVQIESHAALWEQLALEEQQLLAAATQKNYASYFCP